MHSSVLGVNYLMQRSIVQLMLTVIVAGLVGCGEGPEALPEYDRLQTLQLRELFRAIAEEEHGLAVRKLERLAELAPESPGIHQLLRLQVEATAISAANEALHDHDIGEALNRLRRTRMQHGSSAELDRELKRLEGLLTVQQYLQEDDYPSGQSLAQAVAELPDPELYHDLPMYAQWHADQRRRAAARLAESKQQQVERLLTQIDLSLVQGASLVDLMESLRALAPNHPVVTAWQQAEEQPYDAVASDTTLTGSQHELVRLLYFRLGPSVDQERLATQAAGVTPVTAAGTYLSAIGLWQAGQQVPALLRIRQLQERVPRLQTEAFDRLLLQAAETSEPSPSVPGLLDAWHSILAPPAR